MLPTLIVVSGPPGSGKTTLAHALAGQIGCPAICRDEIKEGMAHATPAAVPGPADELSHRTVPVFFDVIDTLLTAGVTIVAEAAFQDRLWRPGLERLRARIRIVHCVVDPETAFTRMRQRHAHHRVHGTPRTTHSFDRVSIDAPALTVDTTDGYDPGLDAIAAFINS